MTSLNKHILIGRVGGDPVVRKTQTGKSVCEISIATQDNKQTEWHKVILWEKSADFCAANIRKGSLVYVEGSCVTEKFTNKKGEVQYSKKTIGSRITGLSGFGNDGLKMEDVETSNTENIASPTNIKDALAISGSIGIQDNAMPLEDYDEDELPF